MLRNFITITKKEEEDLIRNGFKRNKNNKKIYKRIIKAYKGSIEKSCKDLGTTRNMCIDVKDFMIEFLDDTLSNNATEESVLEEIGVGSEKRVPALFVYAYLVSVYMNYEDCLKSIFLYGEVIDGELRQLIQDEFVEQLNIL